MALTLSQRHKTLSLIALSLSWTIKTLSLMALTLSQRHKTLSLMTLSLSWTTKTLSLMALSLCCTASF